MDLPYSLVTFFMFTLFFLVLFKQRTKYKTPNPNLRLPPGPPKLPIIGSMHHLMGSLTHRVLRDLSKKYGPVIHLRLGEIEMVVVSSPQAASDVTRTHDHLFSSQPPNMATDVALYGNVDLAYSPYGDYWRQLRKICVTELLSASRVRSFASVRDEETARLVTDVASAGSGTAVNLSRTLSAMTNAITCRAAFRKASRNSERFVAASEELMRLSSCFNAADLFPSLGFVLRPISVTMYRIRWAHRQLDMLLSDIIEEHQQQQQQQQQQQVEEEDLVDVLLRVKDASDLEVPITIEGVKAMILFIHRAWPLTAELEVRRYGRNEEEEEHEWRDEKVTAVNIDGQINGLYLMCDGRR